MSALPPKADIERHDWHVRFVPKADICTAANESLFDRRARGGEPQRPRWIVLRVAGCRMPFVAQRKVKMRATLRSIPKCSGSNFPPIREDRSSLPIENQSFVNSGEGVLSLHFLFQDLTQYQE